MVNVAVPPLQATGHTSMQFKYLTAAFRVGMLAMETLARRVHDDRPQTKYARNPPYGEDVKWLLAIAIKLGECPCRSEGILEEWSSQVCLCHGKLEIID